MNIVKRRWKEKHWWETSCECNKKLTHSSYAHVALDLNELYEQHWTHSFFSFPCSMAVPVCMRVCVFLSSSVFVFFYYPVRVWCTQLLKRLLRKINLTFSLAWDFLCVCARPLFPLFQPLNEIRTENCGSTAISSKDFWFRNQKKKNITPKHIHTLNEKPEHR